MTVNLAIALARTLLETGCHGGEAVATVCGAWMGCPPLDHGHTTARAPVPAWRAEEGGKVAAARCSAGPDSQANGSLMRSALVGVWAGDPGIADRTGRGDSRLTHPHPVCVDACGVFAAAIAEGLRSGDRTAMLEVARAHSATQEIADCLDDGIAGFWPEVFDGGTQGWVLIAFRNAFCHLARGDGIEEILITTAEGRGDSDTNAATAGALTGASVGLASFPRRRVLPVLSCRPDEALIEARARAMIYWPDDLAEALVGAGRDRCHPNVTWRGAAWRVRRRTASGERSSDGGCPRATEMWRPSAAVLLQMSAIIRLMSGPSPRTQSRRAGWFIPVHGMQDLSCQECGGLPSTASSLADMTQAFPADVATSASGPDPC